MNNNKPRSLLARFVPHSTTTKPVMSERRIAMRHTFGEGDYFNLMMQMYKHADEYLFNSDDDIEGKRHVTASMRIMLEDFETGTFAMLRLLLTIHPNIVATLIDGTIGYYCSKDPKFRAHLYDKTDTSGIYANSIQVKNRDGQGLTSDEWVKVLRVMKTYCNTHKKVASATDTPAQKEEFRIASAVENAYGRRNQAGQRFSVAVGARHWMNAKDRTLDFYRELKKRANYDLDPEGETAHKQSPLEVGMSHNLEKRMKDHLPDAKLHKPILTWGLTLSCMKVADIVVEVIGMPILKITEPCTLHLGEILITMLGGSLIGDGGFNVNQPGVTAHVDPVNFDKNIVEVFSTRGILGMNLRMQKDLIDERLKALNTVQDLDHSPVEEMLRVGNNLVENLNPKIEAKQKEIEAETAILQARIDAVPNLVASLVKTKTDVQSTSEFGDELAAFLAGAAQ